MSMAKRIDKEEYRPDETLTIKIPFTLPYAALDRNYEAARGSFEYQGEFFKLVKQKLEGDTLYVVVIKDVREKLIFGYMADFVKGSSDLPGTKAFKLLTSFAKDYEASVCMALISNNGWSYELSLAYPSFRLLVQQQSVESPPPDFAV